jgi:mevalonate kinase
MLDHVYPSKMILFGEHTILNGSRALVIPYAVFGGSWSFSDKPSERRTASRESIKSFLASSKEKNINHDALGRDLEKGLWFDSTIPQGYGLGSSGALIAAIYKEYGNSHDDLLADKKSLAHLEDHFHGSSSGIDPLVSYVQRPMLVHSLTQLETLNQTLDLKGFFLLDTGKPRQAGPLIKIFQEKMKDPQFKQGCADVLTRDVNSAIEGLIKNNPAHRFQNLWHISKFQWEFFPEMIPTSVRGIWNQGLESGDYVLKLCGAGGGGFLLGYTEKLDAVELQKQIGDFAIRML